MRDLEKEPNRRRKENVLLHALLRLAVSLSANVRH